MKIIIAVMVCLSLGYAKTLLTLDEAIDTLKKNNKEIIIARFDEQIKNLEYEIAQGSKFGSVDLMQTAIRSNDALSIFGFKLQSREATFADFGFKQFNGSNYMLSPQDLNKPNDRNHFQTTLNYTLPLYIGGKLNHYEKITQALHVMSQLEKEMVIFEKVYEVKKSFYTLFLLQSHIKTLTIIASNTKALELTVREMIKEGYAKSVDLLEVESRYFDIMRLLSQAQAHEKLIHEYLSFLIDMPFDEIDGVYETIAFDEYFTFDTHDTLGVKKAVQGVEISKLNIAIEEGNFLPQVSAFANYGSSDDRWLNDFSKHDAYTVGLQMRWNLFNAGKDKNSLEKARVENLKAVQQLHLSEKGLLFNVTQMKIEIERYGFEIMSLQKEVEVAHKIYENYIGRYREKLASMNDVLSKQSDELMKISKLKEVQNGRNEKVLELQKLLNKERL